MGITEENQEELNGFQLYLDELEGITSCSEAENTELAKEAANGSAEAKKRLIEGNLKNALAMIREYLNKGLPAGDLVQEANMALVMAVEELGTAESVLDFNEYLKERVTEALKAAVADQETEHKIEEKMLARVKVLEEFLPPHAGCPRWLPPSPWHEVSRWKRSAPQGGLPCLLPDRQPAVFLFHSTECLFFPEFFLPRSSLSVRDGSNKCLS